MNPLERALSDELARAAAGATAWPDPAGRVRAAAHRQQQRRVVAAVAAAVTGVVVLTALAAPSGGLRGVRQNDVTTFGTESPSGSPQPAPSTTTEPEPQGTDEPTREPESPRPEPPGPTPAGTAAEPGNPPSESPAPSLMTGQPTPWSTERPQEGTSPSPDGDPPPAPEGPGMRIGQPYRYDLYTHCGIEYANFDGRTWRTEPLDDGNGNPPPGWGNPYQPGVLTLTAVDAARFQADNGETLEFEPAVVGPRPCD